MGLNLSIFEALSSLEPGESSEEKKDDIQTQSISDSSTPSPPLHVGAKMLPSCTPSSALFSTNNGIYVIRPSGPSLQAVGLSAGQYILVPSTFEPTPKKFILDVHILSSTGGEGDTSYRLTQLR